MHKHKRSHARQLTQLRLSDVWDIAAQTTGLGVVRLEQGYLVLDERAALVHGRVAQGELRIRLGDWLQELHPADRESVERQIRELICADRLDLRYRLGDGAKGKRIIELHARRLPRPGLAVEDIVGVCRDVTEQVLMEGDKEAAERANRAKTEFLSRMSHELRTPLNAILGYSQLLRMRSKPSEFDRRGLQTIEKCGNHLLSLINDILDLSRIEVGAFELNVHSLALPRFLQTVADIFSVKAQRKKLDFMLCTEGTVPAFVKADERRLLQVLFNLVGNAVKFTDAGQVRLTVSVLRQDSSEAEIRFEVSDTGVGIPAQDLRKVFESFRQVGDPSRRKEGSGLGLTITRALVRQMGGKVQVASEPGHGSRFWFELKLPLGEALAPAPVSCEIVKGYEGSRKRVLVADDARESRGLLEDMLSSLGFDTRVACNGQEALALARSLTPHLVLVDREMPVMNGLDFIRELRQDAMLCRVPVIAVSAGVAPGDRDQSLAAGADAFLPKPVDLQQLLTTIGHQLSLHWVH